MCPLTFEMHISRMIAYQCGFCCSVDTPDGNPVLRTSAAMRRTLEIVRKLAGFVIGFDVPWAERPLGFDLARNRAMMS